ncbi:MAG: hypothetical protein EBU90_07010 [Proteobacteria bacterium]|nr:hypothetical protein [Pseudomonadota bacterium]NBP14163.1 hypothetical protein [bacterium]
MGITLDKDAFSNGQIDSKLWLCRELENLYESIDSVYIYGGWYAMTAFLLKSRERIDIKAIRSFDIDPACESIADMLNENWVYKDWQFKAITKDCNEIKPRDVDLIINTSTEHFESMQWWTNIAKGRHVALQGNNMLHDDHVVHTDSLDKFLSKYPLREILFQGTLDFNYPDKKFTRFMTIGIK